MSKFKLRVSLRQQTPIIHFQHNEHGATLRASEVKPKLDRFLIDQYTKLGKEVPRHWQLPQTKGSAGLALTYKMRFDASGVPIVSDTHRGRDASTKICRSYFGNMGSGNHKESVFYEDDLITLTITCFHTDLLDALKEHIFAFFVMHNFGTRQSKGFGSFLITEMDCQKVTCDIREVIRQHFSSPFYSISYPDKVSSGAQMDDIADLYSLMKSGINVQLKNKNGIITGTDYSRAFIYQYMSCPEKNIARQRIGNEKAWMKRERIAPVAYFPQNTTRGEHKKNPYSQYRYVRALLGVGDHIEYIKPRDSLMTSGEVGHPRNKVNVTINSNSIEKFRFASPILFKVIDHVTYILPYEPNKKIFDMWFHFEGKETGYRSGDIKTPSKEEFSMQHFMKEFVEFINTNPDLPKLKRIRFRRDGYQINKV